jgi:hypothetical protein
MVGVPEDGIMGQEIKSLIAFITEQANRVRRHERSRRAMAQDWMGTNADFEQSRLLAEQMTGRAIPRTTSAARHKLAEMEIRIANQYKKEAEQFEAVKEALERRKHHET